MCLGHHVDEAVLGVEIEFGDLPHIVMVLLEHVHENTERPLVVRRVVQGADPHVRFPLTGIRIERGDKGRAVQLIEHLQVVAQIRDRILSHPVRRQDPYSEGPPEHPQVRPLLMHGSGILLRILIIRFDLITQVFQMRQELLEIVVRIILLFHIPPFVGTLRRPNSPRTVSNHRRFYLLIFSGSRKPQSLHCLVAITKFPIYVLELVPSPMVIRIISNAILVSYLSFIIAIEIIINVS